jgi:hypothetical protein
MEYEVHLLLEGSSQDPAEVGQEVRTTPTPLHSGPDGLVETEMGVGKEQQTEAGKTRLHVDLMCGWPRR